MKTSDADCATRPWRVRVPHILAGCSVLAQSKYLRRHNAALKILFFEMLRDRDLVSTVPPWYSPVLPKLLYENDRAKLFGTSRYTWKS